MGGRRILFVDVEVFVVVVIMIVVGYWVVMHATGGVVDGSSGAGVGG